MIPYGRQSINAADVEAVVDVLRSDWLTQGPAAPAFERAVSDRVGAKYAVAVNSGTSALHIACLALGLGPGDQLWTVPNTFVASANCGRYCGADVDFVDIDPLTWNMSVSSLAEKLFRARRDGRVPKIVVPVHFSGQPTEQQAIRALSEEYGFNVLEDASHAVGASRDGEPAGSCRWSDITVFSFHPVKVITTGEGGMALTNDSALAERMSLLRSHGITRDPASMDHGAEGDWYYEQVELGFNYRMTDIQAALGVSQMRRLDEFITRRRAITDRYRAGFARLALTTQAAPAGCRSACHLCVVRVDAKRRERVFASLREAGVGVNVHYIPVHLQPYYRKLGFGPNDFPQAEQYASEAISLPIFAALTEDEQAHVMQAVRTAVEQA